MFWSSNTYSFTLFYILLKKLIWSSNTNTFYSLLHKQKNTTKTCSSNINTLYPLPILVYSLYTFQNRSLYKMVNLPTITFNIILFFPFINKNPVTIRNFF